MYIHCKWKNQNTTSKVSKQKGCAEFYSVLLSGTLKKTLKSEDDDITCNDDDGKAPENCLYKGKSKSFTFYYYFSHIFTDVMSPLQISIHYKISSRHIVIQATSISHVC